MTKQQKRILIILGIVNFLIVIGLGGFVIYNSIPYLSPAPIPMEQNPCVTTLFGNLPPEIASRQVSWTVEHLELKLYLNYGVDDPPESSAQYLWVGLDSLVATLRVESCKIPKAITVFVTAQGQSTSQHHVMQIDGESLRAWAEGTLSDADLANTALYRRLDPYDQIDP